MMVVKDRVPQGESRAERARRKAAAAKLRYAETLEEIKEYAGILLALRDRKIRKLEAELARLRNTLAAEQESEEQRKIRILISEGRRIWQMSEVESKSRRFTGVGG